MATLKTQTDFASWSTVGAIPVNSPEILRRTVSSRLQDQVYCFTLHEIFNEDGVFKQTRSSPNWQGGVCTIATCKHQMRTWLTPDQWIGKWCAGFTPAHCANNALFFLGQVRLSFPSNYNYTQYLKSLQASGEHDDLWLAKQASLDPRGDSYEPSRALIGEQRYDPANFEEPMVTHTRMEIDSKTNAPKWFKDVRYILNGKRPPVLLFDPVFLFSRGCLWSSIKIGRAVIKTTIKEFSESLQEAR